MRVSVRLKILHLKEFYCRDDEEKKIFKCVRMIRAGMRLRIQTKSSRAVRGTTVRQLCSKFWGRLGVQGFSMQEELLLTGKILVAFSLMANGLALTPDKLKPSRYTLFATPRVGQKQHRSPFWGKSLSLKEYLQG